MGRQTLVFAAMGIVGVVLGGAIAAPASAQPVLSPPRERPNVQLPASATAAGAAQQPQDTVKILLVDDDESDNNNIPGDKRLSKSDRFYRHLLEQQSLAYDAFVVPRYANGPTLEQLRPYRLIVWYTGASYGGNRDNTSVVSLKDEEALRAYLATGGSAIVLSPGYLNNALGAGGAALWAKKDSPFLKDVLGIQGGRALLQRGKEGGVAALDGTTYLLTATATQEVQLSAVNPVSATTLFTAQLNPEGTGAHAVAVATSNPVGSGHMVYVGFTFEDIGGKPEVAFSQLLQAAVPSAAWQPASFDHTQVQATAQCARCHTGASPPADGKPTNHVPYASVPVSAAANCDGCHKGSFVTWANGKFHANFTVTTSCASLSHRCLPVGGRQAGDGDARRCHRLRELPHEHDGVAAGVVQPHAGDGAMRELPHRRLPAGRR